MRLKLLCVFLSVLLVINSWAAGVPVGTMMPWAFPVVAGETLPPDGWLFCYGQYVATNDYPDLYNCIGYTFGGSGANFNLPDTRQRVVVGCAYEGTFLTVGQTGGVENVTLTVAQIPSHYHRVDTRKNATGFGVAQIAWASYTGSTDYENTYTQGGGLSHNNLQPYIVMNYIIKVVADPVDDATLNDLNEALMWRLKSSYWIFGGLCALTSAFCFFMRS